MLFISMLVVMIWNLKPNEEIDSLVMDVLVLVHQPEHETINRHKLLIKISSISIDLDPSIFRNQVITTFYIRFHRFIQMNRNKLHPFIIETLAFYFHLLIIMIYDNSFILWIQLDLRCLRHWLNQWYQQFGAETEAEAIQYINMNVLFMPCKRNVDINLVLS